MPWPSLQDFNEAIQSPKFCFDDAELKTGEPESTAHGLPRAITGGFASVYRMRCVKREWAVRCFLREFSDHQQRYAAISNHLASINLPYTVGFDFLQKGIRVGSIWYPILKMEWVNGQLLNDYIKQNLQKPDLLLTLANRWVVMTQALQKAGICHGDLQHGNVLVVNGDFRLIDYDGMYVPALSGQVSHEVGHRNYQHPLREESDFGGYIDNFSAWVIYISLVSLGIDQTLWQHVGAGEEFILFRKEDFVNPDISKTFSLLVKHRDYRVQSLASLFQSLLFLTPQQVPQLDSQPSVQPTPVTRNLPPNADWISDHLGGTQKPIAITASFPHSHTSAINAPQPIGSSWVLDFIQPPALNPKTFNSPIMMPRLSFWGSVSIFTAILSYWAFTNTFQVIIACYSILFFTVVNVFLFRQSYRRDSVFDELDGLRIREAETTQSYSSLEQQLKSLHAKRANIVKRETEARTAIIRQTSELKTKEQGERDQIQLILNQFLTSSNIQRLTLNREESDALNRVQSIIQSEINKLTGTIATLSKAHTDELASALSQKQNQFLINYLAQYHLTNASITGIGDKLKARLRVYGISTAADIQYWKVTAIEGIGANKGTSLVTWRNALIAQVQTRVPKSLSSSETDAINSKYLPQILLLQNQLGEAKRNLASQEASTKAQFAYKRQQIESQQAAAQNKRAQDLQNIQDKYARQYVSLSERLVADGKDHEAEIKKVDAEVQRLQKRLFDCNWQLAKVRHELKGFEFVSFKNYFFFVVVGHKAKQRTP